MNSPFYTTTFSNDEDNNDDLELFSIKDQNYIGPKDIYFFDGFPGTLNNQTKGKDNPSMKEYLKVFSNNDSIEDNSYCQEKRPLFSLKIKKTEEDKQKIIKNLST